MTVVEGRERVGDVALGVEEQRLRAAVTGLQAGEHLAGQRGQPAQAVRPGDGDDVARQGADRAPLGQGGLLAAGVAEVGGNSAVGVVRGGGDGAGAVQQRGGAHQTVGSASSEAGEEEVEDSPSGSAGSRAEPGWAAGSSKSSTRPRRPEA